MRRALLLVVLSLSACAAPPPPKVEAPPEPKEKKLDCKFARNVENCWRTINAKIVGCIGGRPMSPGKFDKEDPSLCELPDDVAVKLAEPCNPDGKCEVKQFFVGKGDKKCAEIRANVERPPSETGRGAGSLEVSIAEGTVRYDYDDTMKRVTCPDGVVYEGSGDWKKELAECADDTGYPGVPAWAVTLTPSKKDGKKKVPAKVSVELGTDPLFECVQP